MLHLFNSRLLAPEEADSELTKSIKHTILAYLNEKYSEPSTSDLLDISSFIDPRFRGKYISSGKLVVLKEKVICEAERLLGDQGSSADVDKAVSQSTQQSAIAGPVPPITKKKKTLVSFFVQDATPYSSFTPRESIENELSSYLQSVCLESDADPLQWWQEHEVAYPALSTLAKKYLCVPATSSPSERIFSCSGNIVTCQRSALKPDTVDRLVFLAQNIKM